MSPNKPTRCPECGGLGSSRLGGYCQRCRPKRVYQEEQDRSYHPRFVGDTFVNDYGLSDPFFPDSFAIIKDKAKYVR